MKRLLLLCMVSVVVVGSCLAMPSEVEEVASLSACPCSKSCRCDESCRCRVTGCRGCCNQYKDDTKADAGMCVANYCDCADRGCGCGCSEPDKGCCS